MTITGTLAEAFGRIVAILPQGALEVTYGGSPLTHHGMRRLGIWIGDNATFRVEPGKLAELVLGECYGEEYSYTG